ncbi:hypothetical protein TB1_033463 [Malus domestica]
MCSFHKVSYFSQDLLWAPAPVGSALPSPPTAGSSDTPVASTVPGQLKLQPLIEAPDLFQRLRLLKEAPELFQRFQRL